MTARPTLERQREEAEQAGDTKRLKAVETEIAKMEGMYPKLQDDAGKAAVFLAELDEVNRAKKAWYTEERVAHFEKR